MVLVVLKMHINLPVHMLSAFITNVILIYYMKAENVAGVSSRRGFVLTCAVIISIYIATILNVSYNEITPSDLADTFIVALLSIFGVMVCTCIWMLIIGDSKYAFVFVVSVAVSIISCLVIASAFENLPYYDDCNMLKDTFSINRFDCMEYAISNPDVTGAEIVEVQTVKIQPVDTSILDRSLNP